MCAESVQDLMATIAKLDSNGVQVLPEPEPEPAPVHSSTDDTRGMYDLCGAADEWPAEIREVAIAYCGIMNTYVTVVIKKITHIFSPHTH